MNPLAAAASSAASSAASTAAPAAASAATSGASAASSSFSSNFGSMHLPGFESRNPNAPTIKFIASLIKGALLALSLGLGPGQMLLLGLTTATAASGKSAGQLASSKPASPLATGGSTSISGGSKGPMKLRTRPPAVHRTPSATGETPPSSKRFPM